MVTGAWAGQNSRGRRDGASRSRLRRRAPHASRYRALQAWPRPVAEWLVFGFLHYAHPCTTLTTPGGPDRGALRNVRTREGHGGRRTCERKADQRNGRQQ